MKKVLFIIMMLFCLTVQAEAQKVSRAVTVRTTELGNQRMEYLDGEFILVIKSSYKPIIVPLGNKENALRLLAFLRDTKFRSGDIVELENEAGSVAKFNGLKQFQFYSEGRQFTGQIGQRYMKGYYEAVEKFETDE